MQLNFAVLKARFFILILIIILLSAKLPAVGQCSVCTKTAQQMGEKPAMGLNQGILYLMFMPFGIVGFIGYRWWKLNKSEEDTTAPGTL